MDTNEDAADVTAVFQDIGDLEKDFANVELDARMLCGPIPLQPEH